MSSSSSGYAPARQPYLGSSSSNILLGTGGPTLHIQTRPPPRSLEPNLDNVELAFLRTVGRMKIPVAASEDIELDCVDRHLDTQSRHGATMQVHRGTWKGRKVAFKYIRRGWLPDDGTETAQTVDERERPYRQDMYDLNFELQVMSKPTLRSHPNITQLLAVCFSASSAASAFAEPGLIVEVAHEQFPDLASFFDVASNPSRLARLPYRTAASFICDIADGIQILHDHDLVHADLKPANILLFPSSTSPCNLTAKIADFGFMGMTTYTSSGIRAPLPDGRPRGGTPEWNAPECLRDSDPLINPNTSYTLDYPQYKPARDIYAFGLVVMFIALDGQIPSQYVQGDLSDIKYADKMLDVAVARIEEHYLETGDQAGDQALKDENSLKSAAIAIACATLHCEPPRRTESLRALGLRALLFNDIITPTTWPTEMFVLAHNLFPDTAHGFRCSGLYNAYWASPSAFRKRVYTSFARLTQGVLPQLVRKEIWELLERPPGDWIELDMNMRSLNMKVA